jgi:hypothetical protein
MMRALFRAAIVVAAVSVAVGSPAVARAVPPSNDDFANATTIDPSALPFSDSIDTTEATTEANEPQWCYYLGQSVWYAITPSSDATLRIGESISNYYADVNIYREDGSGLGGLSFLGCAAFGNSTSVDVHAGTTYYFQGGPIYGGSGTLQIDVQAVQPPANDDFANATIVNSVPFADTVDTAAATVEPGEPNTTCFAASKTVWYAFTPSTAGSYSAGSNASLAAYTGNGLGSLTQIGCRNYGPLTFHAEAGVTYYFQESGNGGTPEFSIELAPPPQPSFYYNPGDPSSFDTVQFYDYSYDPAGNGFSSEVWNFGDGATTSNPGCCPTHRYAKDGDYRVELDVTTTDGRTASAQQVIHVRTHDVTIAKLLVPQSARAGQTKTITIGLTNSRYPETVQVQLLKSVAGGGFQQVGQLTQSVPVRGGNRTTDFSINYTFSSDDASLGKVTFEAIATIQNARDALPSDNAVTALPTKVTR